VTTVDGQLSALLVPTPVAGSWSIVVTAPAGVGFSFQAQTVPSADVVGSTGRALTPLYATDIGRVSVAQVGVEGSFDHLVEFAVAAFVGVVAVAVGIGTGGTVPLAVLFGLVALTGLANLALDLRGTVDPRSTSVLTRQIGGMAGFLTATGTMLLIDANADRATILAYGRRSEKLYPYVDASRFGKKQQQLVGSQVTQAAVAAALTSFTNGLVSAVGHGKQSYLMGWYVNGASGALQEVLTTGKVSGDQALGRIFHVIACYCGDPGSRGLGRDLVAHGAVAFFGYSSSYKIAPAHSDTFYDCDMVIDTTLIEGKTCDDAYIAAKAAYTAAIETLQNSGDVQAAATLKWNLKKLVAPSTDAAFGSKTARLT
jgi:hypothetical protein